VPSPELGNAEKRVDPLEESRQRTWIVAPGCVKACVSIGVPMKRYQMEQAAELDVLKLMNQTDRERYRIGR
jgi:hypothetical protein